ncbi:MAG: agmatinase [Candidatus Heimdallarchaeota archaeon]|nr:agmatinase [Candidatus Heimdallarchaeota archaeon]
MEFHDDGYGSFGGLVYQNIDIAAADVIIVGIPYESALSGKKGSSYGPSEIRFVSKDMQTMTRDGEDLNKLVIADVSNIPVFPVEGSETRESIYKYYLHILDNTNSPILALGGDHSSTYPMLKALSQMGSVAIIWFDAHRDLLGELIGSNYSHGSPLRRAIELDNVDPKNVLLVGTRYMEPEEQEVVDDCGIKELRMVDLENNDFNIEEFQELVKEISSDVDYLYVSIDIDVLDPAFAPGTGTPVSGGMTTSQLMKLVKSIPGEIRCVDIMEVSPPLDNSGITVKAAMGLITEVLGKFNNQ